MVRQGVRRGEVAMGGIVRGKHVRTLAWSVFRACASDWRCDECSTSCQSACKTSCTVASQVCPKDLGEAGERHGGRRRPRLALA